MKAHREWPSSLPLEPLPASVGGWAQVAHRYRRDWGHYEGVEFVEPGLIPSDNHLFLASRLAHIAGEVGEAVKCLQNQEVGVTLAPDGKPEGMVTELCDVILLSLDVLHGLGYDAQKLMVEKMLYNFGRPPREETGKVL